MKTMPTVGHFNFFVKAAMMVSLTAIMGICVAFSGAVADENRWVHPLCQPNPVDRNRPFVAMPDGGLMTVDAKGLRTSKDEGKTWSEPQPVCEGINPKEPLRSTCCVPERRPGHRVPRFHRL